MPVPLRLSNVSFAYRHARQPALSGLDLSLDAGRFAGLTGRTGAGKTTCVRVCNGLVPHVLKGELTGSVELFGQPIDHAYRHAAVRRVAMVFQDFEAQLFSTTVRSEVAFGLECRGVPPAEMPARIDDALSRVGLAALADREPGSLSGGQKQRLAIACALAARPEVLILDEPTTDLDPVGKQEVASLLDELAEAGSSVLLVEHEPELLARAHRLYGLEAGKVVSAGAPGELEDPLRFGVRPPDLRRLWQRLGLSNPPASIVEAAVRLGALGFAAGPDIAPAAGSGEVLFQLENATFRYAGGPLAIDGVSLEIRRGETVAVLGSNGAGKTTLAGLLNGLRRPSAGRVLFEGRDIAPVSIGELGRRIGFVFQNPDHQIFAPTVVEEVAFGLKVRGVPEHERAARVERALAQVGLAGMAERDPFVMTRGERQKLALASVLVHEPEILILDEPTTGLDAAEQEAMAALLNELSRRGGTLVVITHSMDTALAVCGRTLLLAEGKVLADGPTREIFAQESLLAKAQLRTTVAARLSARLGLGALNADALAGRLSRRKP